MAHRVLDQLGARREVAVDGRTPDPGGRGDLLGAGVILGSKYSVLTPLNLPRIPVKEGALATGGAIALAAIVLGTLLALVVGGGTGRRYHGKVDAPGYER
jgi:hypothetical protein